MYIARFSYDVLPVNRQRAIDFIRKELKAAEGNGLKSRMLVPFTRGPAGAALQFEIELHEPRPARSVPQSGFGIERGKGSAAPRIQRDTSLPAPASRYCALRSEAPSEALAEALSRVPSGLSDQHHDRGADVAGHEDADQRGGEWKAVLERVDFGGVGGEKELGHSGVPSS